jgi:hypothetical protein
MNQSLLPASERLKTVNLQNLAQKNSTQNTVLDSVGASTKEVCWLPTTMLSTIGEQAL